MRSQNKHSCKKKPRMLQSLVSRVPSASYHTHHSYLRYFAAQWVMFEAFPHHLSIIGPLFVFCNELPQPYVSSRASQVRNIFLPLPAESIGSGLTLHVLCGNVALRNRFRLMVSLELYLHLHRLPQIGFSIEEVLVVLRNLVIC